MGRSAEVQRWLERVFPPRVLVRVLGAQYALGGLLALGWLHVWHLDAAWYRPILALGVLAVAQGVGMLVLSTRDPSTRTADRLAHVCILSAEVLVVAAWATTEDPGTPLLFFLLWTTAYAGVLSPRARWAHVGATALLLTAVSATTTHPFTALGDVTLAVATMVVVTLVVSRTVDRLHRVATLDPLTALPNRRVFHTAVEAALARRATAGGHVLVLVVDLDGFKDLNDARGHEAGDVLLAEVARRLQVRAGPRDVVARLGGDEFAVLHEGRGPVDLDDAWDRVHDAWHDPVDVLGTAVRVRGSVGIAVAAEGDDPQTLLRDADAAMYQAKAAGGDRWRAFDDEAVRHRARVLAVERGLRRALAVGGRSELALHYQPVVRLRDRHPIGLEALMRWTSPELGAVPPEEFVAVAEQRGMVAALGRFALDRALADLRGWQDAGLVGATFQVAVNVSPHELSGALPELVHDLLERHGVDAACLALEVTESAVISGPEPAAVLRRLRAAGVTLLMDDFGTGYSSITHLRRFPVDVLKIDRSFVSAVQHDDAQRSLALGVVRLAHALGMTVVAEGLETDDQLTALRDGGCDAGQGYGIARPVPAAEVPEELRRLASLEVLSPAATPSAGRSARWPDAARSVRGARPRGRPGR